MLAGRVGGGGDVDLVQHGGHLLGRDGAAEADPLRDAELGGELLELLLLRAGAADVQAQVLPGAGQRTQQQVGAVPGLQGAHEADGHGRLRAGGGHGPVAGGDAAGVHAVGGDDHVGGVGALVEHPFGHGPAHAGDEARAVQLAEGRGEGR